MAKSSRTMDPKVKVKYRKKVGSFSWNPKVKVKTLYSTKKPAQKIRDKKKCIRGVAKIVYTCMREAVWRRILEKCAGTTIYYTTSRQY